METSRIVGMLISILPVAQVAVAASPNAEKLDQLYQKSHIPMYFDPTPPTDASYEYVWSGKEVTVSTDAVDLNHGFVVLDGHTNEYRGAVLNLNCCQQSTTSERAKYQCAYTGVNHSDIRDKCGPAVTMPSFLCVPQADGSELRFREGISPTNRLYFVGVRGKVEHVPCYDENALIVPTHYYYFEIPHAVKQQ
jgi:hypothetical protein